MLLQFSVENYRSFRDEAVLSMMVPSGAAVPARAVVVLPDGQRVFRVAAVYGANASGKSNLVRAMRDVGKFVQRGTRADEKLPHTPFRLNRDSARSATRVSWIFRIADACWAYGIEFDRERVLDEYLTVREGDGAEQTVFERTSDERRARVKLGQWWPEARRPFVSFVAEGTRPNQPLLAEARERAVDELLSVSNWFESVVVRSPEEAPYGLPEQLRRNASLHHAVEQLVCSSIDGVERIEVVLDEAATGEISDRILKVWEMLGAGELLPVAPSGRQLVRVDGEPRWASIRVLHSGEGLSDRFELAEESDGTIRFLELAATLCLAQQARGAVSALVIDELDRSLHSLLSARFIDRFLETAQGSRQLIFTTHDTYLLRGDLVPPACVWFTEKHPLGSSALYSLAEFKQEQIDHFVGRLDEGYLQGRFGAIPFVARRESLRWSRATEGEREAGE